MTARVLRMQARTEAADRPLSKRAVEAMQEAVEIAGLGREDDLPEIARRVNLALGCSVVTATMVHRWLAGIDEPQARVFLAIVRVAGAAAAPILVALTS